MAIATIAEYRAKRAAARRAVFGQEPPAPRGQVLAFNAGYDAGSPDWPLVEQPDETKANHFFVDYFGDPRTCLDDHNHPDKNE
jgi:hypothetical protein